MSDRQCKLRVGVFNTGLEIGREYMRRVGRGTIGLVVYKTHG